MSVMSGKEIRMKRIFKEDGKSVISALDFGMFGGSVPGLEDIRGMRLQGKFTLITPADVPIRVGDRILPGIGPEARPENAPAVVWVQPMYLGGSLHHFEAGN